MSETEKLGELVAQGYFTYNLFTYAQAHAILAALSLAERKWDENDSKEFGTIASQFFVKKGK